MRNTQIFAGSSCPALTDKICENLGMAPAAAELGHFSNGETNVRILTSVREKDVFIVQSGSPNINDSIMELLIMISACKGGSAAKITAVMPYFPYSRQSKKKSHRGAITARMLANLLTMAGVKHVITVDLHASQMQGFFKCPVDNLHAEPLIAKWIRHNVPNWREAVVVSKNAGGTKRVTSLADALKLNFALVTTDRKRGSNMSASMIMNHLDGWERQPLLEAVYGGGASGIGSGHSRTISDDVESLRLDNTPSRVTQTPSTNGTPSGPNSLPGRRATSGSSARGTAATATSNPTNGGSPFSRPVAIPSSNPAIGSPFRHALAIPSDQHPTSIAEEVDEVDLETEATPVPTSYLDERAREVTHGRLVQGHIVPDDFPSPSVSATSGSNQDMDNDPMTMSHASSFFQGAEDSHRGGGSAADQDESDEEEEVLKDPRIEHMITLVGDVKGRTVFIVDDMIDKPGSWIAAAETVVKRGFAKRVYCIATHAVFGGDCLRQLQDCECINQIVVTNSFPIPTEKRLNISKLTILDLSILLAEAIRRNHHGESIAPLFQHISD